MITSLPELYLGFRRFILLVQIKKWFLWTVAAAQPAENHGDQWGLTWYLQWRICTSIPTWNHTPNSLEQQKHWVQKYPPTEHMSNDHKDHPNQHKNSHKLCDEMDHPIMSLMESQRKLRQQHDQSFPMRKSHYKTNTDVKRRKEIPKSRSGSEFLLNFLLRDLSSKVNHLRSLR